MMITSPALVRRLMRVDLQYAIERMGVIAARPGNPFGIEVKRFGEATALLARHLPSPRFNRVVGLEPETAAEIPEILQWYAANAVKPRFEVRPTTFDPALGRALACSLYFQSSFHASLHADAAMGVTPPPDVRIEQVTMPEEMENFLDIYLAGWNLPDAIREPAKANMRGWIDQPAWRLYRAYAGEAPSAVAILYMHDRVGYFADAAVHPSFRGRHLQSALLAHRWSVAHSLGAELVYSQAEYASTSHRNMERAGMRLLHTHADWTTLD